LTVLTVQDGGGRHLEISKNRDISATVEATSTKFGVLTVEKFEVLKIQDGGGGHLEKYKNHHISAAVQAIF